jgi:hypothetical protein
VSGDVHTPTNAGPLPDPGLGAPPLQAVEGHEEASRPELLAGAAFAGGLVAAMVLKRLGGGDD